MSAETPSLEVKIFPLVSRVPLPVPAPPGTREHVPAGYGVQEQCLPFTAATALGFLIKSPITFGVCTLAEIPNGGLAFRSPLAAPRSDKDEMVFYVKDDPACSFIRNAFTLDTLEDREKGRTAPRQPGISFFDRGDQLDLFKLHLPYIWRTPPGVDTLFLPAINRDGEGPRVLSGLVETDWYANQVNLVFRKPERGHSVHVASGNVVGQVIFVERSHRRPTLKVLPSHARLGRELRDQLTEWFRQHEKDRSAYKRLARSEHGRMVR